MTGWEKFLAAAQLTDGVSKLFRMFVIAVLLIALTISSITSCSRGHKLTDLKLENQDLKTQVLLAENACED